MIFPKNGGSVDAIDHFWRECSSKVIFWGEWRLSWLILGGVWSNFMKFLGEVKISSKKFQNEERYAFVFKNGGGRHFSKEMGFFKHQI